jgi:hypothetical protein
VENRLVVKRHELGGDHCVVSAPPKSSHLTAIVEIQEVILVYPKDNGWRKLKDVV